MSAADEKTESQAREPAATAQEIFDAERAMHETENSLDDAEAMSRLEGALPGLAVQ